jgi:hypothetical protein
MYSEPYEGGFRNRTKIIIVVHFSILALALIIGILGLINLAISYPQYGIPAGGFVVGFLYMVWIFYVGWPQALWNKFYWKVRLFIRRKVLRRNVGLVG